MEVFKTHRIAKEIQEFGYDKDYEGLLPEDFANLTEEEIQLLGGDEKYSHLIKGLDLARLEKRRRELERQQEMKKKEEETALNAMVAIDRSLEE